MSKRLQVVVDEAELRRFQRAAKSMGVTLSEWSRQVLRAAERQLTNTDPSRKLAAIRTASGFDFPAPQIDQMLDEIEQGYRKQKLD